MKSFIDELKGMSPKQLMLLAAQMKRELTVVQKRQHEAIAIVGMGCRFPGGVTTPEVYWERLCEGYDGISDVPADRWDNEKYYDPDIRAPWKIRTKKAGFLSDIDLFDASFFEISPREAMNMDPQQRMLLEVSWEAFEQAGITQAQLYGKNTGVFIGISGAEYLSAYIQSNPDDLNGYMGSGSTPSVAAGRVSYTFGLTGPSITYDTACSSSLVAIHHAVESLRRGECDSALAGATNLILLPETSSVFSKAQMLSPDGYCKTFDESANGFVRGEGCGVVVLKRLSDAQADGDHILAVIRGSAVNQDGATAGLTVPNGHAQQAVIRAALDDAGLSPAAVGYIESHGTGTALGDPIELGALGQVFRQGFSREQPLWVGSVKTNVGHLEAAAGMASLCKVVMALQKRTIPPHLHFQTPSSKISWDTLPVRIPTQTQSWEPRQETRIAGISAFSFMGTNAHILVEQAPTQEQLPDEAVSEQRKTFMLKLSAKSLSALRDIAADYLAKLQGKNLSGLDKLCAASAVRRSDFAYRLAAIAETSESMAEQLQAFTDQRQSSGLLTSEQGEQEPKIAFLFTGQGSQYVGMGKNLYQSEPHFRYVLDQMDEQFLQHMDVSLLSVLWGENHHLLDQTQYTQPALFAIAYALTALWEKWGIRPDFVMGHSVGEYAAACTAGVFSWQDGFSLICARGRLMAELAQPGGMLSVLASVEQINPLILADKDNVTVAADNGPQQVVLAGDIQTLERIQQTLHTMDITTTMLNVSHGFHSPLMTPMLEAFREALDKISFSAPKLPVVSNITGELAEADKICQPQYWLKHVLACVQFRKSIQTLQQFHVDTYIEIGTGNTLLSMGRQVSELHSVSRPVAWLPSLARGKQDEWQLMKTLGHLYVRHANICWAGVYPKGFSTRIELPGYPFQRRRYWFSDSQKILRKSGVTTSDIFSEESSLLGKQLSVPADDDIRFEKYVQADMSAILRDHYLLGHCVISASYYAEMLWLLGRQFDQNSCWRLQNLTWHSPCIVADGEVKRLHSLTTNAQNMSRQVQVYSQSVVDPGSIGPWTIHFSAEMHAVDTQSLQTVSEQRMKEVQDTGQVFQGKDFYQYLSMTGYVLGDTYRWLRKGWTTQEQCVAHVRMPETVALDTGVSVYPGLFESCYQSMMVLINRIYPGLPYALSRISQISCYENIKPSGQYKTWVKLTTLPSAASGIPESLCADIMLVRDDEAVCLVLQSVEAALINEEATRILDREQSTTGDNRILLTELSQLSEEDQLKSLHLYLCALIAPVLQMNEQDIPLHEPVTRLGIDSLMAIDIRTKAKRTLGVTFALEALLGRGTLNDLAVDALQTLKERNFSLDGEVESLTQDVVVIDTQEDVLNLLVEGEI
ncbi:type I polyketide synthase [Vibrio gazogenes]|uniref:Uncharacterized protein n=1 Tax=Vibrio gazogenes TaxID=687 RepID=A0A1Z2SL33_VIBGA|nr:type I polyketide synthase [Vibrio gazogenes]ASA57845.1 hypothetical protein BSQ33_19150 [Vibrio gazogenes]